MKERQPPSQRPLRLSEQRVIDGWENGLCLGKRFERAEQVEEINAWLEERRPAWDVDANDLP